ncbi:MAG: hypothetical protein MUO63_19610 [Desulfobulbaceae bacterium]|nr:hypothetical protein [Desulfobulbaceae bacterium]
MIKHESSAMGLRRGKLSKNISTNCEICFDRSYSLNLNKITLANKKYVGKQNAFGQEFMNMIIPYVRHGRGEKT